MHIKYPILVLLFVFGLSTQVYSLPENTQQLAKATTPAKANLANGKELFLKTCASCHGTTGKADNKMGKALKARDLTTEKFKFGETDAALTKTITKGNGKMPGFKQLKANEVNDLIEFIKSLRKKK